MVRLQDSTCRLCCTELGDPGRMPLVARTARKASYRRRTYELYCLGKQSFLR